MRFVSLLFLSLGACDGGTRAPDAGETRNDAAEVAGPVEVAPDAIAIRVLAEADSLAHGVMIHAGSVLFEDPVAGAVATDVEVELTPPVKGQWKVEDAWTVRFEPEEPFKPATSYTVAVKRLPPGEDGAPRAPTADWTRVFETPSFTFLRGTLREWQKRDQRAVVDLAFSGPVKADEVAAVLKLEAEGLPIERWEVSTGSSASHVRISFPFSAALAAKGVEVKLAVGPVSMAGHTARSRPAEASVTIDDRAPPVDIRAVVVKEGANGHYLEVYCDDGAVETKRHWWDRDTWDDYYVSTRCEFDEDSIARSVHFSPATSFTTAPGVAGFRIFGDFHQGDWSIRIDSGATTVDGGRLPAVYEADVKIPHRKSALSIGSGGRYLPRSAWQSLAVTHTNVDRASLSVRHVPAENLVFWMSGSESADQRSSNVVLTTTVPLRGPVNTSTTSWIDLASLLPDPQPGLYQLSLHQLPPEKDPKKDKAAQEAAEPAEADTGSRPTPTRSGTDPYEGNARSTARVLRTNLHLIAKTTAAGPDEADHAQVVVWVVDVHDNRPVADAEIRLVRPSGKTMGRCRSDTTGNCRIEIVPDPHDSTPPIGLIATHGDDLSYLRYQDLRIDVPETSGLAYQASQAWLASVYPDRGVYRPGETAHIGLLLRGREYTAPAEPVPVVVKLYDPSGKEAKKKVVTTNAAGMATLDLPFGDYATTGSWRVEAVVAHATVGEAKFNVEEFVPERLRVEASLPRGDFSLTDSVDVSVTAAWLFGGQATGSRVEAECRIEASSFSPKNNKTFHYGPATIDDGRKPRPIPLGSVEAEVDEEGKASLTCPPIRNAAALTGPGQVTAQIAVFEGESGRSTTQQASGAVHPDSYYLGLRTSTQKARAGRNFRVDGVVVDWSGNTQPKATSAIDLEFYRLEEEYSWTWNEATHDSEYRRSLHRALERRERVTVADGTFTLDLKPGQDAAGYLVVVSSGKTRTELHVPGFGRWWWSSMEDEGSTPRPDKPTEIAVSLPEKVSVGNEVPVELMAPYAGRLLISVETDTVLQWAWKDVKAGPVSWAFKLGTFAPNVYVSALLIKDPHLESAEAFLPDRAYGNASVKVEPVNFVQKLDLSVPPDVKPGEKLKIGIDVGPGSGPSWVTVAAIDEGILSLTRYKDPNPEEAIFRRRALGVESYETIGWTMLFSPGGPSSRTGGDAEGANKRVSMVKPVSLWSGLVEIPASGKAEVSFDIPRYRGELRVMAVSGSAGRMGHASARVTVKEPLVLQTTVPRFLVAGDAVEIPVFVANMTGKPTDVTVKLNVEDLGRRRDTWLVDAVAAPLGPPLGVSGAQEGKLSLKADANATAVFRLQADRAPSVARVRVVASGGGHSSVEELEIPVVAAEPEMRRTTRLALDRQSVSLSEPLKGWVPGSDRTTVWVTRNPYAEALGHLRHLVRYPYGCIEQTTSSTRPLLYVSKLVSNLDPALLSDGKLEEMVQRGIDRVLSMQTASGGFAYWPGGVEPTPWGSVYGTNLLLDAKDAGYPVPESGLADALDYLGRLADNRGVGNTDRAYAHFLLARAGKARVKQAEQLLESLGKGAYEEEQYLLRAAVWLGGDRRHEAALKKVPVGPITMRRHYGWSFWSDLRERALILSTYRDLFGTQGGGELADAVYGALTRSRSGHYNTQELAWGITGLGKSVGEPGAAVDATLKVAGKTMAPKTTGKGSEPTWNLYRAADQDLNLTLAAAPADPLYAVVTVEGNRLDSKAPVGGVGLAVDRSVRDAKGDPLGGQHELGDMVYVELSVTNRTREQLPNLALVDRIPSGFEIENPRLGRGALPEWADPDTTWTVAHMNVRDDRLELFGELNPGETRTYVYAVRAVTAGTFTWPETAMEQMYDPELWAREAGGPVKVVGPWTNEVW